MTYKFYKNQQDLLRVLIKNHHEVHKKTITQTQNTKKLFFLLRPPIKGNLGIILCSICWCNSQEYAVFGGTVICNVPPVQFVFPIPLPNHVKKSFLNACCTCYFWSSSWWLQDFQTSLIQQNMPIKSRSEFLFCVFRESEKGFWGCTICAINFACVWNQNFLNMLFSLRAMCLFFCLQGFFPEWSSWWHKKNNKILRIFSWLECVKISYGSSKILFDCFMGVCPHCQECSTVSWIGLERKIKGQQKHCFFLLTPYSPLAIQNLSFSKVVCHNSPLKI